ncbi:MAG: hypothetical protein WCW93_00930 [Candidatus Paceibacterota bacterium]
MEGFDFSKPEDQKRFDDSSLEVKKRIIEVARTEANQLRELVVSGKAKDYSEAL